MKAPHVLFIGRTTLDAVYWLDRLPPEDTKAFAQAFRVAPGGPACNAALTHASLGGQATLISPVGTGPLSRLVTEKLAHAGIALIDVAADTEYATPLTTVLVASAAASRTIVNPPAAAHDFRFPSAWNSDWGQNPHLVLTDGFHLPQALPLLHSLHRAGVPICLDGGSWKEGTDELAPLLASAICSERFAVPGTAASPEATLTWFAQQGVPHTAVTRGSRPILANESLADENGRRFEIPIRQIHAIDTLAAGDVLHGAFCFYTSEGQPFEAALSRASETATRACEALGIDHLTPRAH